jgi:hypothetical protein
LKNEFLQEKTAADIDKLASKILRDLGNPEPPLDLKAVRQLLTLDRAYYSSTNEGAIQEFVHQMKMAGKGLISDPTKIKDIIFKFDLKALWLPEQSRILLDESVPTLKQRWIEGHEIGHSIIPWHKLLTLGDNKQTLTPTCHKELEGEANFAAGRLLFLGGKFFSEMRDLPPCIDMVIKLAKRFGNTNTTTLWRVVELLEMPAIGMVTSHPRKPPEDFDPENPCRYFVRSRLFEKRFGRVAEVLLFDSVKNYCGFQRGGPLGKKELNLSDDNGDGHIFYFETFHFGHDSLTLGIYKSKKPLVVPIGV